MNPAKTYLILVTLVFVIVLANESLFTINEQEQVVITQFGKPVGNAITKAGIHFKIPFIQKNHKFDKRFLEWNGSPNQVPTKDKKFIYVDSYARWQITQPLQFFKRLRDERGAQSRLDDILDGETRIAVASNFLAELVRTSNRVPQITNEFTDNPDGQISPQDMEKIDIGRQKIEADILTKANERAKDLGINILDFRFKRINYGEEVRRKVYERMISERNRIADKFRSEGQGEASRISGERSRELKKIQSEAFKEAEEIRGDADAKAALIYSNSYNRNNQSRELYYFVKSMETFEKTLDENTTLVISADSPMYQYLNKL